MSKLDNLLAKPKKYTIDGVEIELKPLTIQHIDTIMKIEKPATQAEGMKEIVIKTLEQSGYDEKEIKQIKIEHMEKLVNAILDVNGLVKKKNKLESKEEAQ